MGGGLADGESKGPPEEGEEEGPEEEAPPDVNPFFQVYRYYSSDKTKKPTEVELDNLETKFRKRMDTLKSTVSSLEKPDGSREYPARTCRDLHEFHPTKPSGMYWLDPNKGCKEDAIKVHCNFTVDIDIPKITTCVYPTKAMAVKMDAWPEKFQTRHQKYFDEGLNLGQLDYSADLSQMIYLGYLNKEAFQNVTIHCKDYQRDMKFMGVKNTELTGGKFAPSIHMNQCSRKGSGNGKTVLHFTTSKFIRLPIVDFAPEWSKDAKFGIELGPVCFV